MALPSISDVKAMSTNEREALTYELLARQTALMNWIQRAQDLFERHPECGTVEDLDRMLVRQGKPGLLCH